MFPVVMRYKERKVRLYFRGDAAFASPEIYEYLEAEGLLCHSKRTRFSSGAHLLTRPVGRPPDHVRRFHGFSYQAGSWNKKRRVWPKLASWFLASITCRTNGW